jgi:4-amino-4-deoxy-L-arabinose transferase-like glycosyltransferase
VGTVTVGLCGLVALELLGPAAALAALILAALYPVMIELSGALVAENLFVALELAAVWTALRAGRSWRPVRWVAVTGVLCGLAILAHENGVVLLIPLAVGVASAMRGRRLLGLALLAVGAAAIVAPWTIRNAIELHHFVPVSDETGITLRGTYNPESASDSPVPYKWRFFWQIPQDRDVRHRAGQLSEVALSGELEHRALHYIGDHPGAPPAAGWHNLERMFELEGSRAWHDSAAAIDLSSSDAEVGVIAFWLLCLLALAGAFAPTVRAAPKWPWAVPVLLALSVVFVNVETPRFREPIDPFLVLLAAAAVAALSERVGSSRR